MISVLLRNAGFQVEFLGPDIPLDDLVIYADSEQPRMIILSATLKESVTRLEEISRDVEQAAPAASIWIRRCSFYLFT